MNVESKKMISQIVSNDILYLFVLYVQFMISTFEFLQRIFSMSLCTKKSFLIFLIFFLKLTFTN